MSNSIEMILEKLFRSIWRNLLVGYFRFLMMILKYLSMEFHLIIKRIHFREYFVKFKGRNLDPTPQMSRTFLINNLVNNIDINESMR